MRTKYYYGEYTKHSEEGDHFPEVLWMKMVTNCEGKVDSWHGKDFSVIKTTDCLPNKALCTARWLQQ